MGGREVRRERPDGSPRQPGEPGAVSAGTPTAALPGPAALELAGQDGFPAAMEPAEPGAETEGGSEWGRRRREILDAAAEVFFLRGFDRGTTKEVAARVGLTQPAIYHYVGSKQDLIVEIARQVDGDFSTAIDSALAASSDPVEQLRSVVYAFTDALSRNRLSFALYWKEYRAIPPDVAKSVAAHQRNFIGQVSDLVAKAQKRGALPAAQPTEIVTQGILGMLSWVYWWYRPDGPYRPDDIARGFLALIGLPEASEAPHREPDSAPSSDRSDRGPTRE
jgi:TetR/AcrR family transcriptional regulator, cholesterol catabolism regulator